MKYLKKLLGDNIYLSPMNSEDYEKFAEWLNDFNITDYTGKSSQLITLKMEKEYFEEHIDEKLQFAIVRLKDDELIGTISLENINNINRTAILGIFIGDKSERNKGYGTESIKLILDYGFNYINLNNIKLDLIEFNNRALACYKKCGFKEYGRRRKSKFLDGKYYDTIEMDILADEFKEKYIKNRRKNEK